MQSSRLESLTSSCARLALFSALLLNLAVLSQAQTTPPPTHAAAASTKPAAQPRGNHEGIKVHGHWTIEVRNPNGTLVSHTEFENSLVQPAGGQVLTALLLGETVPGGYAINLASQTPFLGPCAPAITNSPYTNCLLEGSLTSPTPAAFVDVNSGCGGTASTFPITAAGPCFPLSINGAGTTSLVFMGTAVAASTTVPITDVHLYPLICPFTFTSAIGTSSPSTCAQGAADVYSDLTHATLPTPVQITAVGQLISVNVQLSFQ